MSRYSVTTEELKQQIAGGDTESLSLLYDRYFSKLKLYGLQFSPKLDSYSIEDSIQELFIWIAKNHKKLAAIDNLEVYLFSALKRNSLKEIGLKNKRDQLKDTFQSNHDAALTKPSVEIKYIESENRNEEAKYITQLLDTLPPQQKEVLYLRNYMDMSFRDIGQLMGLSEQVVRNYNYRAIKDLRSKPLKKQNKI